MHAPAKSLLNLDGMSRRTLNDWETLAYICAVSVPNETNKEQIAALAARGDPIKTNSAEYLCGPICKSLTIRMASKASSTGYATCGQGRIDRTEWW